MTDLPIREAGVYSDIDPDDYHNDCVEGGSLSSSGARALLPPGCPAQYHWDRHNPPPPKPHFDVGTAAHTLVLGKGRRLVSVDVTNKDGEIVTDWKTKAAQDKRDEIRAAGHVPLLRKDYDTVHAMAEALHQSEAGPLFEPGTFDAEQVIVWRHNLGWDHIWRRAMIDLLPHDRSVVVDYKTAESVDPDALARAMANYRYHQQADFYRSGLVALGLVEPDCEFWFVAQSKTPPYLVTMFRPDDEALDAGRALNEKAMRLYAECVRTGEWPGHSMRVETLSLPRWAQRAEEED